MGTRKTKEELNEIKKQYTVNDLWSWSRYNTYKSDHYAYFLKYIKHVKEDRKDSIYCASGGYCHDILENYYNGKLKQEDMIESYEDSLMTMNLAGYKYDRSDEDKNDAIARKYESCIKHFFRNHIKPDNTNMILEMFCLIKITDDIIFNGYIDNCDVYKDENGEKRIIITDYKTSTIYKGEKLEKESGQLYLYAEGIRQKTKLPLDHISIRYLFLKYVTVNIMQANGKWKERQIERNQIGEKLMSNAKMWLKKCGYNPDDYTEDIILYNSLDNLPDDVKEKFIFSDCYVQIPLTEEKINELKENIIETVNEINSKSEEYNKTKDEKLFWIDVTEKDEYFLSVLSGYSRKLHKPYNEYLEQKEMFNTNTEENENENEIDNDLLDFLADL
ncbi:MAG TPA: PD-(D/E)XK nuclease family protein [Bacteroidales bacterium]|nr:PD-(D/E)XK nuclease family protein [Bacteroidales bacterium]